MNFSRALHKHSARIIQSYMNFVRGGKIFPARSRLLWCFLIPAAWITGLWVGVLDYLYRHGLKRIQEPSIPVISVGNLSYGGTNKTPFVEMLCRMMQVRDIPVGIISRGYGGNNSNVLVIEDGKADRRTVGDEPLLLSARLPGIPVAVSPDRIKGLQELVCRGVELAIADDAFQHRRVTRDADIVLIDAACPFGNGHLIPAGILREPMRALKRAHIVVITKVDQLKSEELNALRAKITEHVPEERIFNARLEVVDWASWDGAFHLFSESLQNRRVVAFSAIGNPDSFIHSLNQEGVEVAAEQHFRDHHTYSAADMERLSSHMKICNAEFLVCTEKDIYNLPRQWTPSVPLIVPRVATVLDEPERFFATLVESLRPRVVVASNGYGEDAIGVLLARKLRAAFPEAEILTFPLVGRGEPYRTNGFTVASTPSVTPSGGVLKYRLRDLWGDIRAGLFGHIRQQLGAWGHLAHTVRTPICVGDVYLLLHTLWGQGATPLFVATAKTVYLSGHWRLERFLIRNYSRRVWTRDADSAVQLTASRADALYAGNPIMDLLGDAPLPPVAPYDVSASEKPLVMLLPGSRLRAYDDVKLLLSAVENLQGRIACNYVMVLAPTLELPRLVQACSGWVLEQCNEKSAGLFLTRNELRLRLHQEDVSSATIGVRLLIGLGGTANQLCAGIGIPVVSIDEKGKRVQKKLLEDSEILVEPTPDALADCAFKILTTPELHEKMSTAGKARMGERGALDNVAEYAGKELGWRVRCEVYEKLKGYNNAQ